MVQQKVSNVTTIPTEHGTPLRLAIEKVWVWDALPAGAEMRFSYDLRSSDVKAFCEFLLEHRHVLRASYRLEKGKSVFCIIDGSPGNGTSEEIQAILKNRIAKIAEFLKIQVPRVSHSPICRWAHASCAPEDMIRRIGETPQVYVRNRSARRR